MTETKPSSARSAQWVAAGILLSRIAGLVRERVFARFFGTSMAADAFSAALRMPNVLQNLLGEGTLSASFIPVYSKLLEDGREEEAGRVAGAIFALLFAIAGGLALLGVLLAPLLVSVFTPGFEGVRRELTIQLVRIMFPMTGVLVLSAWALGILNSHRRFFIPYVAPVLWNAVMIGAMLLFGPGTPQGELILILGWSALIGGLLQFLIQLPWVLRLERQLKPTWNTQIEGVRTAARNAGPAILGRGVVQLSTYVDMFLASFLVTGAVAVLRYAQTLYVLPVSLFGMSIAAAELPELSRQRDEAVEVLRARVSRGLRQMAFYVVPSIAAYWALGDVLTAAILQVGDFDPRDTVWTHLVLSAYTIGLMASTGTRLFSSAFFALHDTKTPAKIATVRVSLSAALGVGLMLIGARIVLFEPAAGEEARTFGPVGLALAAGIASWVEWWLLRRALDRRIGRVSAGAGALVRMVVAATAAAAAGRGLLLVLPPLHPTAEGGAAVAAFGLVYIALGHVFGLEEAGVAMRRVVDRLRR